MKNPAELFAIAKEIRLNAYAPYSKFYVGACLETANGKVFSGCNVENASYSVAICAEANAISTMIAAGEKQIRQLAVVVDGIKPSAPCGACRQRIFEFATPETQIHIYNTEGEHESFTIDDLLPRAFGPADLG